MVGRVRGALDRKADSTRNARGGHRAEVRNPDQGGLTAVAMDVSRRTLIVGGTSAIAGAGVGAARALTPSLTRDFG